MFRYNFDSEMSISCGADQTMLFSGDASSNHTLAGCARLAYALRFIAQQSLTPGSAATRSAVCDAAQGLPTTTPPPLAAPSILTIFFNRDAEFERMYDTVSAKMHFQSCKYIPNDGVQRPLVARLRSGFMLCVHDYTNHPIFLSFH